MKTRIIFSVFWIGVILFCIHIQSPHSLEPQDALKFQHAPYAEGMCKICHSSDKPSSEDVTGEAPDSCYNCHKEHSKAFIHSPVSVGACLLCHNPHESDQKFLLNQKLPELCYLCHGRIEEMMTNEQYVKHAPAEDNCVGCHNPHESDVTNTFLRSEMGALCTDCHIAEKVPMESYVARVTHKHEPVEEAGRCAQCHMPHASPFDSFLKAEPMDVCLTCHNSEVSAYDGEVLANMEELLENNPEHHGPIMMENCSGCHNPHGSDYFRILTDEYPETFYTENFSVDNYALCFACHESSILKDKETTTLTNFRDGATNFHFLHVNRAEKGRTCRACHETHASTHPKHIRDAVPFGKVKWPLELKYRVEYSDSKTGESCDAPSDTCVKTGGSCVACHKRVFYNYKKGDM